MQISLLHYNILDAFDTYKSGVFFDRILAGL